MLKFKVTNDNNFIELVDFSLNLERSTLDKHFTKRSKSAEFNVLVTRGIWDGNDKFFKENKIAIGLWKELYKFAEDNNFEIEINGLDDLLNLSFEKSKFNDFVNQLLEGVVDEYGDPIKPRDYQQEAAYRAIKYNFCTQELATSAGKTLIFYIYNSFLKRNGIINSNNKSLIIVPNVSLVGQTAEKFKMYSNGYVSWNVSTIGGDDKFDLQSFEKSDILITTYQSLINFHPTALSSQLKNLNKKFNKAKKDERISISAQIERLKQKIKWAEEFNIFSKFSVVNVDEVHKSRGNSIQLIIDFCKNWKRRLGLSGTVKIEEKYSDFFKVQESVGPLVMILDAKHLQDKGYSPKIKIKMVYLKYDENDVMLNRYWQVKKDGSKMYANPANFGRDMLDIEKKIIYDSEERLKFINQLVKRFDKNSLILFSDVKNGYGKKITSMLSEWNVNTFYIDGSVDSSDRDSYKDIMEKNNNTIIVASYGTFATGIDLKNVHHIVFVESTKAEITIRQAIGRGMRKLAEKNKVTVWDLIDDIKGYSVKHSEERFKIYTHQKFEVVKTSFDLTKV